MQQTQGEEKAGDGTRLQVTIVLTRVSGSELIFDDVRIDFLKLAFYLTLKFKMTANTSFTIHNERLLARRA